MGQDKVLRIGLWIGKVQVLAELYEVICQRLMCAHYS